MRRPQVIVLVVVAWALAGPASAQGLHPHELTVDEIVARALGDNPELRAARTEVEAAAARLRQAALRPNPTLDLGGQKALGPDNTLTVGLTVPLDLNGRKEGRVGVAERELEFRRLQVADRERRLRAEVRIKAGEVLAARRNLAVVDELIDTNRASLRLVEERVRAGAAPALDGGLARVEVNRLEASRPLLASRVEVATLQLKALAGMRVAEPIVVRGDLSAAPVAPDAAALAGRLSERPDVRAAGAEIAMAEARVRRERAEGRWDASVNLGYQRQDMGFNLRGLTDTGGTRPIQDVFHFFGGGVSITLPVRNRNEGNVAAAVAEAAAAERRREFVELIARQELEAALAQSEAARRAVAVYERGVRDIASANVDVVRRSYGLGRATLLDVIAEQRRYIDVEQGYTDVLRQVWDAAVEVERAIGGPAAAGPAPPKGR